MRHGRRNGRCPGRDDSLCGRTATMGTRAGGATTRRIDVPADAGDNREGVGLAKFILKMEQGQAVSAHRMSEAQQQGEIDDFRSSSSAHPYALVRGGEGASGSDTAEAACGATRPV
ncbi:unnamed protein product [Prorocentrum cordatum]|uniref:Uncharacterized protein n=1 Tax=Prorocentrum cordatum TaxID=2364126 RepID=A0ABN9QJ92_9DINO|nr:unnamed protein product [Polarella glacialis]